MAKIGRNDPCHCGSGKKYKQCCANKERPTSIKKFKATVLSGKSKDLVERTFSSAIANPPEIKKEEASSPEIKKEES